MKDYYAILGVLPSIDDAALTAIYRALIKKYHPDVYQGSANEAHRITLELNEAYEVLGNIQRRADYDRQRRAQKSNAGDYERRTEDESGNSSRPDADIERDWAITVRYHPGAEDERSRLEKISRSLALQYQITILENKSAEAFRSVSEHLKAEFLKRYFGSNIKVHSFVLEALNEGRRDVAEEVNRAIKVLGSPSAEFASRFLENVSEKCRWDPLWVRELRRGSRERSSAQPGELFPGWWIGAVGVAVLVIAVIASSTLTNSPAPSAVLSTAVQTKPTVTPAIQAKQVQPSFDCAKVTSDVLKLVCRDEGLAELDLQLAKVYATALSKSSSPASLRDDERAWIFARNNSAADVTFLRGLYTDRIAALAEIPTQAPNQSSAAPDQNSPVDGQKYSVISATVASAVEKFYAGYNNGGTSEVVTDVDDCYSKATDITVMYCVALDTAAETVFPAVEKAAKFPPTPQFEEETYDARVRLNMERHGVSDHEDQNRLLAATTRLAMQDLARKFGK